MQLRDQRWKCIDRILMTKVETYDAAIFHSAHHILDNRGLTNILVIMGVDIVRDTFLIAILECSLANQWRGILRARRAEELSVIAY